MDDLHGSISCLDFFFFFNLTPRMKLVPGANKHIATLSYTHANTWVYQHINTLLARTSARSAPLKMSQAYRAERVRGGKRTQWKMSVSPIAMTAGNVWQRWECFIQKPDYLSSLIKPLVSSMIVWGICYKKRCWRRISVLIKQKTKQ